MTALDLLRQVARTFARSPTEQ